MATLLSINNYFYRRGGAETVFFEQNRLLKRIGWTVVPFAMRHSMNIDTEYSKYFVDEIEFGANYSAWEKLVRIPKVIYSVEARRKLNQLLNDVEPDICHIHNIYHHISPSILGVLKQHGVPVVLTLHDLKLACPAYSMFTHDGICERCKKKKLYNIVIHRCVKRSVLLSSIVMVETILHKLLRSYENNVDRFVVPSLFYLEKMIEWGWERRRFVHIPNFVDVEKLRSNFNVGKAFLFYGRLSAEKGIITFIKAAALAKVPAWIAGTGPQEDVLRELAARTGADITFLGYLNGEALFDAVRSARTVVLPSEWYENAPLSVMEACALGKPVIGARIGGIPELIREGETGITFQSGSVESLAAALRRFADMPDAKLADMGRQGRAWMESDYTAERYRERLLKLYYDIGVIS